VVRIPKLVEITLHEALHVGHARIAVVENLEIDRRKMVVGVGIELALI